MKTSLPRVKRLCVSLISGLAVLALVGAVPASALAQDHHGSEQGGQHPGWGAERGSNYSYRRGERMGYNDWNNAPVVDYRAHHLRRPSRGYEWREHNGQYVMVAIATGLIASVFLNHR